MSDLPPEHASAAHPAEPPADAVLPPPSPAPNRTASQVEHILPLASLAPAPSEHDGVLRPDGTPTELLPTPATVEFAAQQRPGVVISRPSQDFDDEFADFADPVRVRGQAKILAGPLAPPDRAPKRLIRYDLLAGAALLLAILALVPLLLLRGDPEEMSSNPRLPPAGGVASDDVTIELAEPVDLTDKVQLTWSASRDLDFAVAVAPEGEEPKVMLAERNRSMTVAVKPGVRYCFQIQATDGGPDVYLSESVGLRGATCR